MPLNIPSAGKTFVVEHLDPELEQWQILEYRAIADECAQAGSAFVLSGVPVELIATLPPDLQQLAYADTLDESLERDRKARACLLDPKGDKDLSPADGEAFDVYLFGGILGDDPPRDRTGELRSKGFIGRRLGKEQMTTDTAARVTRMVVQDGHELEKIPYVDRPDIQVGRGETVSMPFKYVKGGEGKPVMPAGMLDLLAADADKNILDLL